MLEYCLQFSTHCGFRRFTKISRARCNHDSMGTPSSIDQIPPQYNRQHVPQTLRDEKANTPEAGKLILPSPKTNYEIVNMCILKRKKSD